MKLDECSMMVSLIHGDDDDDEDLHALFCSATPRATNALNMTEGDECSGHSGRVC